MPAALVFIVIPAQAGIQRWPNLQAQQEDENAPLIIFLSTAYSDFLRSQP
jgi:hypothetical protein